uniref:AAA+ ATPase domain-containing protein n=1 Tax=Globisporangium ultimum (strain ATCC 200006 / CBS 805.95 / DAOM BR144) TaxID=431595 RepID=K3WME4_GLOUD
MPLVVFCGLPGAGKSFVATALVAYLRAHVQQDVEYITEASVHVDRRSGYNDSRAEKTTRSALKAAAEKAVNASTIVVLDALNYIKGVRYELFCKARAESTTYCVVYVDTPLALALERNAQREDQFDSKLIEELAARFEVPMEKNRWDNPLFHLTPEVLDSPDGMPLAQIADAIRFGKTVKAGLATKAAPVAETSFVQELDAVTNAIVEALLTYQREGNLADGLRVPKAQVLVQIQRTMPTSEARRHRRQFIKIAQLRPCVIAGIGDLFVEYLNQQA